MKKDMLHPIEDTALESVAGGAVVILDENGCPTEPTILAPSIAPMFDTPNTIPSIAQNNPDNVQCPKCHTYDVALTSFDMNRHIYTCNFCGENIVIKTK